MWTAKWRIMWRKIIAVIYSTFPVVKRKQGCHGQGKVREKRKFFKVREKSEFFRKSGKISDIVKVREFCFLVYSSQVFFKILKCVFFWKRWKACCKASKAINLTLYAWHVYYLLSGFCREYFLPNSFFLFRQKAERRWKWRENHRWPAKTAKGNVKSIVSH